MDSQQCTSETSCGSLDADQLVLNGTSGEGFGFAINLILTSLWLIYWVVLKTLLVVVVLNTIPLLVLGFLYISSFYVHLYQFWNKINEDHTSGVYTAEVYERARNNVVWAWDLLGKIWFGFELHGTQNLPKEGGAILAYYHGTIPIDVYFIISKIRIWHQRAVYTVADRFVYKLHGLKLLWRIFAVTTGSREECVRILKEGNLMAIAPGGTREAYFSDSNYPLLWYQRKGFAIVAKESQVPIIPVFTQNCREAFRTPRLGRGILRWLYEKTRAPLVPIYGGFPVKLRTYIGAPIKVTSDMSVDDIVQKAREGVESLIRTHQQIPGSIRRAFLERWTPDTTKTE
ncbi:DGAT1/2-independent enzyme synthesizing storage lipids-like [Diadema antillarum]|uniref:DGAT1/2-independent enzyme synthesizing storage lipids-like n=1 Tax=Diadema antillarum TaxID=105358 RepID=UPI003A845628